MKIEALNKRLEKYSTEGTYYGMPLQELDKEMLIKIINEMSDRYITQQEQYFKDLDSLF